MNDNHTFVQLRNATLADTMKHVRECWERDPWGMLCGYQPKPSDDHIPGQVHGHGRDKRAAFEAEASAWLTPLLPNSRDELHGHSPKTHE